MNSEIRLRAEWEAQSAVLLTWPHGESDWADYAGRYFGPEDGLANASVRATNWSRGTWVVGNAYLESVRRSAATVSRVRDLEPEGEALLHPCFTGAVYRVVPLEYHGRAVGRFIVGPYVPADSKEPPATLVSMEGELDPHALQEHFSKMPRARSSLPGCSTMSMRSWLSESIIS